MIVEAGHLALTLALALAVLCGTLPLWGAARRDAAYMSAAVPLSIGQFVLVALAFATLVHAFLVSDFSVALVANNSHTLKPYLYKLTGVWGNHEGSLLLWALILTFFAALVAIFGRNLPLTFKARALAVEAWIAVGFLLFMLFTSNPFARLDPPPAEGAGLNPLLQDPGLAFHPPFLYLGYVGLSVTFAFAIAALMEGRVDAAWARWVRPWTLVAWVFLTIGIALGSWWAYYELGWGGFWFWDPVENASFMPWLVATALLHSAIVVEKRDALKNWTILLAIIAFSFSLLGTFLVRSGVLTSVHAFATDPARGVFILSFLVLVVGGSLTLYACRADKLAPGGLFEPISREGALILNNVLLATAAATVLLGTLYPLILDVVTGAKGTVGPPYFIAVFIPLMTPLIIALGIAPYLSWKRADLGGALGRLRWAALVALLGGAFVFFIVKGGPLNAYLGVALGGWRRLPRAQWGMTLAHAGVGVVVLGITGATLWQQETLAVMRVGEAREIGPYSVELQGVEPIAGPNYTAVRGHFLVREQGRDLMVLDPESRTYAMPPMTTTEAAIRPTKLGDVYAVIGEAAADGGWAVRLYLKPLQYWLWIGCGMMALGGVVSLTDRRYRVGAPERRRKSSHAA
jgi:cytochrome c-type biogenesis protein CcmF